MIGNDAVDHESYVALHEPCATLCLGTKTLTSSVQMNIEQFASYLFRGLGRTYLHLQQHSSAPYHEALFHVCLHNPVYDRQCEGSRAAYLYGLISLIQHQQRILAAFMSPADDMDIEQLFDFALIYLCTGRQCRSASYYV